MKIVEPSFEILGKVNGEEILKSIERAGRTCYKSEDKITDESAKKFVKGIISSGHESVIEHEKVSVLVVCDRGVSHEIVRHRIGSYSQESTRYCDYADGHITFVIPPWVELTPAIIEGKYPSSPDEATNDWLCAVWNLEDLYKELRRKGWKPEQARSILPNSLKTEIVITFNLREWRHFFKLRTSSKAHPQMREIARPMLDKFKELIPVVFNDID